MIYYLVVGKNIPGTRKYCCWETEWFLVVPTSLGEGWDNRKCNSEEQDLSVSLQILKTLITVLEGFSHFSTFFQTDLGCKSLVLDCVEHSLRTGTCMLTL